MKVVVHCHVDLDACACVAFAGVDADQVAFLPAGAAQLPPDLTDARVLDHELGEKGRLAPDGTRHAAALAMPEAADLAGSDLLREIDEQDSRGYVAEPRFSLATILAAAREEYAAAGLRGDDLDRAVLCIMVPMLRGLARLERARRFAPPAESVPTVEIARWRFAVRDRRATSGAGTPQSQPDWCEASTTDIAKPCVGVIFHDESGLGVARFPGQSQPDLTRLALHLPGWFIHPAGFLVCWGSRKSPAQSQPPAGTPQNVEELVLLLRSFLL